jgi:hypothetical protein
MPVPANNADLVFKLKFDNFLPSPPETDADLAGFALALRDEKGQVLVVAKNGKLRFGSRTFTGNIRIEGDIDAVNSSLTGNLTVGGYLLLTAIPTNDPGEVGKVWNNAGVLNISAG